MAIVLVFELTINTLPGLMRIQVDEDFRVTQRRVWTAFTSHNSLVNFYDRNLVDQIHRPTLISLLLFAHEPCRSDIIYVPLLARMSLLIGHCQSLERLWMT